MNSADRNLSGTVLTRRDTRLKGKYILALPTMIPFAVSLEARITDLGVCYSRVREDLFEHW